MVGFTLTVFPFPRGECFLDDLQNLGVHVVRPEHPLQVVHLSRRDLGEGPSLMLTSPENQLLSLLLEPLLYGGANRENLVTVAVECIHVPRKVRITLDLRGQDRRSRADVTEGGVRFLVFPAEVEACGGGEVAWLLAMEDSLHVDHPPRPVVEVEVGPLELSDQHRQVEAPDIEAPEVAGVHQVEERFGTSREGCFVRDVLVGDPVDGPSPPDQWGCRD